MTTGPGGPGGENEIDIGVRVTEAGDVTEVARQQGEQYNRIFGEAVAGTPVQLPPIEAGTFQSQIDKLRTSLRDQISLQQEALRTGAAGGGAGGGRVPPTAVGGAFPDPNPEGFRQLAASLQQVQAATEGVVASQERLAGVYRLTAEEQSTLFNAASIQKARLAQSAGQSSADAGFPGLARLGNSQQFVSFDPQSGAVEGVLSYTQALEHLDTVQGKVAESTKLTAAQIKAQAAEAKANRGIIESMVAGFRGGDVDGSNAGANAFRRVAGENAEFLGAIARYQIAYAGIFALSRATHALVNDTTEAQVAQIHLEEALHSGGDAASRYASSLNDVANAAGTSVVASLQAATRGIFAFSDQATTPSQRQDIGTASAQAAAVGSILAGTNQATLQSQLIPVARDFNIEAVNQARVLDAATNAYHNYGAAIGDVLQSLPIVSQQAHQAGLSIEQTANFISLIESRTGQSGSAAGTALARILESVDKPAFKTALAGAGVDVSADQATQIQQLAHVWGTLTTAQQDNFARLAVGSRGAGAFIAIMREGDAVLSKNAESYQNLGAAQQLFYQQQNTLGGLIRRIGADLQSIGLDLSRTGVADVFGVALRTLDPFLHALDDVLRLFDAIPGDIRPWVVGLGEVLAVMTLIGRRQAENNALQLVAIAETNTQTVDVAAGGLAGLIGRQRSVAIPVATDLRSAAGAAAAEAESAGGVALGASALGGALLGPLGVVAGVVALGAAIGGTTDALHHMKAAADESKKAEAQLGGAQTADQFRGVASALAAAGVDARHASGGFVGSIINAVNGGDTSNLASRDKADAKYANEVADALAAQARKSALVTGDVTTSLTSLAASGYPAVTQLRALVAALDAVAKAPLGLQTTVPVLAGTASTGLITAAVAAGKFTTQQTGTQSLFDPDITGPRAVAAAVAAAEKQLGISQGEAISPSQHDAIGKMAADILLKNQYFVSDGVKNAFHDGLKNAISGSLDNQSRVKAPGDLSQQDLEAQFALVQPLIQQSVGEADPRRPNAVIPILQTNLKVLQSYASAAAEKGDAGLLAAISQTVATQQDALAKALVARTEALRKAAQAAAGGNASQLLHVNTDAVESEIKQAARLGDINEVIAIIATADQQTMNAVKAHLEHDYEIAKAAYDAELAIANQIASLPGQVRNLPELRDISGQVRPALASADAKVRAALAPLKAIADAVSAGALNSTQTANAAIDPNQLAEARIQATEIPGSALSAAQVALEVAEYAKSHAKNQLEYWQAVKQVNDAEYQLMQAIVEYHHQARLTGVDTTDPVATTAEDVRAAAERLRDDRARGAGADTLVADINAQRQAQQSHLAAIFDQRLQDAQTAHDLGRTSDTQFLQFLEAQDAALRRQIAGMKKGQEGYRQALDELNKIDEAIKATSQQFAGQFNLGDIKVPSPYEVRRFIAASTQVTSSSTVVDITINDQTSDQRVRQILKDLLGSSSRVRVSSVPPKVA